MPAAVVGLYFALDGLQPLEDHLNVAGQIVDHQFSGDVEQRPSHVAGNEIEDVAEAWSEEPHAQAPVDEDRSDLRRVHQVAHVVVGVADLVDLDLQFLVDGLQLLVQRLQLLLARLQLLGRRAKLLAT